MWNCFGDVISFNTKGRAVNHCAPTSTGVGCSDLPATQRKCGTQLNSHQRFTWYLSYYVHENFCLFYQTTPLQIVIFFTNNWIIAWPSKCHLIFFCKVKYKICILIAFMYLCFLLVINWNRLRIANKIWKQVPTYLPTADRKKSLKSKLVEIKLTKNVVNN